MSGAPRGNREYRASGRGARGGQPSRGKPKLLKREVGANTGPNSNLVNEEATGGPERSELPKAGNRPQYGAPPRSFFSNLPNYPPAVRSLFPSSSYHPEGFGGYYYPAPPGPMSAFAPALQKPPQQMMQLDDEEESQEEGQSPINAPFLQSLMQTIPRQSPPVLPLMSPIHSIPSTRQSFNPMQPPPPFPSPPMYLPFSPHYSHRMYQHQASAQFVPHIVGLPMYSQSLATRFLTRGPYQPVDTRVQEDARRMQRQIDIMRNEPKFYTENLTKFSETLKRIECAMGNKKLAALVETNDGKEIEKVKKELVEDIKNYDGRSNVPVSKSSLPYLKERQIEFLPEAHANFPWAPYYCSLCDFHICDIFAVDAHLPTHMKEEQRMNERKSLADKLPPLTPAQLNAIEKVLVAAVADDCSPSREEALRTAAEAAMKSLNKLCLQNQFNRNEQGIKIALHGSLVSGLLTDKSDINISLAVDGENTKFFVDKILNAIENDAEWWGMKVNESPTGQARIEAVFNQERVSIDWMNDEGVRFSKLFGLYNQLNGDLVVLRKIVHKWAEVCDLTTEEKLSSQHAVPRCLLDTMVIHSLQQSKRLPCIHEIRKISGKDLVDPIIDDVMLEWEPPTTRWNLAELFLQFLQYFSKGDVRQFLIEITRTEKLSKNETKYSKKQVNVIDPIRDRPIAALHKMFLCYFINCFLTTYVHYRIPRRKKENGVEALVDISVYQMASQSPQKKKGAKGGKKGVQKEEVDSSKTPPPSSTRDGLASEVVTPSTRIGAENESDEIENEYSLPIMIHGKPLEKMLPKDFEIDGDCIYSRRKIMGLKEMPEHRLEKDIWNTIMEAEVNLYYPAPDSAEETTFDSPIPSSTPSSKNKRKKRRKSGKQGEVNTDSVDIETDDSHAKTENTNVLSIGQCTSVVLDTIDAIDQASTSSSVSHDVPTATSHPIAKRTKVSKLIKVGSADSSEVSCEPSPTLERKEIVEVMANLNLNRQASGIDNATPTKKDTVIEKDTVTDAVESVEVKDDDMCEKEKKEGEEDGEIVLPESNSSPGLQPTFEELYIKVDEYDKEKIAAALDNLAEFDFDYSFEAVALTAGFKCDQHCSACDSPKHLVSECPQLKVPPIVAIPRDHWKSHYCDELDRVICSAYNEDKISDGRRRELKALKIRLTNAIKCIIKNTGFRLDAFGSSENGFGSNKSDFDICFRYADNSGIVNERTSEMQLETILNIEHALNFVKFPRVMSITTAKVPIVKFASFMENGPGEIEGDISYYNELALHNTQLLKRYCSWTKDEILSKLGIFIKRWAKQCDIGDASKGSLSSYAYIILLIHFLQRMQPHPLLPVLQEIGDKQEIKVDGWDVYFCDDEPIVDWSKCTLSVGELFLQFLDYFSKFDWHNQVVQIRQSNKLSKIERGWRKLMCIEDPFDLDHNLGSGISNRMFAFIMKSFVISREVFFTLKERKGFVKQQGGTPDGLDVPLADRLINKYGIALLSRCKSVVGGAPRDRQCFKCGRIGHFSDICTIQNSGYGRNRDGRGGGGGGRGGGGGNRGGDRDERGGGGGRYRDERGASTRDDYRYREHKKTRLAHQLESYRAANEEK